MAASKKSSEKATPTKKAASTKQTAKPAATSTGGKKANALSVPVQPSPELAEIVGDKPIPRSEVVSKTWDYIKKHKLQNPDDGREILADDKLKKIFGKPKATMFEMNKFINAHLK